VWILGRDTFAGLVALEASNKLVGNVNAMIILKECSGKVDPLVRANSKASIYSVTVPACFTWMSVASGLSYKSLSDIGGILRSRRSDDEFGVYLI
jgi:hypothetical protein